MTERLVWYAAFGSNLYRARMAVYLTGGPVPNSTAGRVQAGSRDPVLPRDDRPIEIPHRLFFAGASSGWGGGGVAFLDPRPEPTAGTRGRAWLVTAEQFADVFAQENGLADPPPIDLDRLAAAGTVDAADSWYGRLIDLGAGPDGSPTVTFTCADVARPGARRPPHRSYREVMVWGLGQSWGLDPAAADRYLDERVAPTPDDPGGTTGGVPC